MIRSAIVDLIDMIHSNAKKHGFWEGSHNIGEKIALIHSEVSELLESIRIDEKSSEKISPFTNEEEECADIIIRVLDYAGYRSLDVAGAILAKHKYNQDREYKHGKYF